MNIMLTGQTLSTMAQREPQTLAALKQAVGDGQVCLVGGEFSDAPTAIYDPESLLAELRRGLAAYETHLGARPRIYGRRTFGLTPMLPQVLKKLGFIAALHTALDGGELPTSGQTKTMWQGLDGTSIDAVARPPLDANKPETFLNFCIKMGESMDSDHVATLYFAHWPGQASPLYDEIFRIAARTPALGKLATLEAYFEKTSHGGMHDRFDADHYRPPYLKQAVMRSEPDPISSVAKVYRRSAAAQASDALTTMTAAVTGEHVDSNAAAEAADQTASDSSPVGETLQTFQNALAELRQAEKFAASLSRAAGAAGNAGIVVNPHSFVRRVCVEAGSKYPLPTVEKPIYSAGESHGRKHVVVDVPPMGFAWVTPGTGRAAKPQKPLVEEGTLRNEYFQVRLDETTGALRSLHDYESRGNRLSQQLALRIPAKAGADEESTAVETGYSVMVADAIEVTQADAAVGELVSRGRLVDRTGRKLAGFVQKFRATRGSRVLRIDIEFVPEEEPRADAWNSYYACRFAWADEAADMYRTVGGVRSKTEARRFESPLYVELDMPKNRTAILTGGLAYHRRVGLRVLDTLLLVRGETARHFTLGVGIDLTHPLQDALSLLTPATAAWQQSPPSAGPSSGWLFHVDSKNVIATHWEPICDGAKVIGFRVRLLEAYARAAAVTLTALRNVASAQKTDFEGRPLGECKVKEDKILFDMQPCEWVQVEVLW
jgi:alpha-mannosidase